MLLRTLAVGLLFAAALLSAAPGALAQGDPFDPAELKQLEEMERSAPVSGVTGGDYSLAPHVLSTLMQLAFFLLPPVAIGYAASRRREISAFFARTLQRARGPEHREFARIMAEPGRARVRVHDPENRLVWRGSLMDISQGGLGMQLAEGIAPDQLSKYSVSIEVLGKRRMRFTGLSAAVAWVAGDRVGLRFDRALKFSQDTLSDLFAQGELAMAEASSR